MGRVVAEPFTIAEVRAALDIFPRASLARRPTPLDEAPRLSEALGRRILVKREDQSGLALGGNKARELEFFLGDATAKGADVLIAGGGGPQSNHAIQSAAAAIRCGLDPVIVLNGERQQSVQGNLLLDLIAGVDLTFVACADVGVAVVERSGVADVMASKRRQYEEAGRRPYVIESTFQPLAALAFIDCACELVEQLAEFGHNGPAFVYVASAGATFVGLSLGVRALKVPIVVRGVDFADHPSDHSCRLLELARATARLINFELPVAAEDLVLCPHGAPGYGRLSRESVRAASLVARTEGIFLDPVYSSKGMAGLIADIADGRVPVDIPVVFVHTGGAPALFSYAESIAAALTREESLP